MTFRSFLPLLLLVTFAAFGADSPLMKAVRRNNIELTKQLIVQGADVNFATEDNNVCLLYTSPSPRD